VWFVNYKSAEVLTERSVVNLYVSYKFASVTTILNPTLQQAQHHQRDQQTVQTLAHGRFGCLHQGLGKLQPTILYLLRYIFPGNYELDIKQTFLSLIPEPFLTDPAFSKLMPTFWTKSLRINIRYN